jgi:VWFA-related protein
VVDREGRLVTDLTADDFEVYDNGRLQPVSLFASDTQPLALVMMLDRSGSVTPHNERVQKAAEELVANLLPEDRARVGSFSRRVEIFPDAFTSDRNELVRVLRHSLQRGGPTPLWKRPAAMNALEGVEGRRVIVVFSDGNSPTFSWRRSNSTTSGTAPGVPTSWS